MAVCPYCGADLKQVFQSLASKGGKAAHGPAKRTRTPAEYKAMQLKSVAARRRRAQERAARLPAA